MDLFLFYISQIFQEQHLPLPKEVCADSDTIMTMCLTTVSFALIYSVVAILAAGFLLIKKRTVARNIILAALSILAIFFYADHAMKQIQNPAQYGIEWFTLSYYLWAFIITNMLFVALLFPLKRKKVIIFSVIFTLVLVPVFAYMGRGNFEQVTPLAGGLFAGFTWKLLWLSFTAKLFCFLFGFAFVYCLVGIAADWVISGKTYLSIFPRSFLSAVLFSLMILIPIASIPLGEYFSNRDAEDAKAYIDTIKPKVDKYFYENGEYPKFIENMLPKEKSPRLLERHEFFTYGIKGTYYFSRADKYCFIFQNPTRKFGYYSRTNDREWRYNETAGSYDEVFINLCDESNKTYQDLISGHLGVNTDDELVNEVAAEANAAVVPATSNKASRLLKEQIEKEGQKNPAFQKFLDTGKE